VAKVFWARGQPHHDKWVAARLANLAARPSMRTAISATSEADRLARMARGT
jgi:hypothetical protein